jgi:hypothetical protein
MNVPRHGSAEALKSRELIVLAAEAALANGNYEMAREQVRLPPLRLHASAHVHVLLAGKVTPSHFKQGHFFFRAILASENSLASMLPLLPRRSAYLIVPPSPQVRDLFLLDPPRDQFCARALFVTAHCDAAAADDALGSAAVQQRLRACRAILEALDIAAAQGARYDFLVYNASVHYWRVVRPLLRAGAARFVVPSLQRVSGALEALDDRDVAWRVVLLVALARADDDAGAPLYAATCLNAALGHCAGLVAAASEREAAATTHLATCEADLAWAQKGQRCAAEGKPLGARALYAASPPPALPDNSKAKGKAPAAAMVAAVPDAAAVPDVAAAAHCLAAAEAARAAAAASLDKAKSLVGVERRREEGCLLQAVHVGRDPAASSLLDAASKRLVARGPRGVGLLAAQRARSGLARGFVACAELEAALDALDASAGGPARGAAASGKAAGQAPGQPPPLDPSLAETVADLGLAAMALLDPPPADAAADASRGTGEALAPSAAAALEYDPDRTAARAARVSALAARCLSRAGTAKDAPPTAGVKLDFLKCHLMVRAGRLPSSRRTHRLGVHSLLLSCYNQ